MTTHHSTPSDGSLHVQRAAPAPAPSPLRDPDAEELARAESEGMIANRDPSLPAPGRRERVKRWAASTRGKAVALFGSLRARVRSVLASRSHGDHAST